MLFYSNSGRLLRLVIILLIGVVSCGRSTNKGDTITPENSSVSYKYKKNVLPPTKKRLSYIKEVRENSIIYKADTPYKKVPKAGEIITSGVCDIFPHGIGVRVLSVQTLPNGDFECMTTPATLDEIFDELEVSSFTNLTPDANEEIIAYDKDGNEVKLKVVTQSEVEKKKTLINKNFLFASPLSVIDLSIGKQRSDLSLELPFHYEPQFNPLDLGVTVDKVSLGKTNKKKLDGNIHAGLGLIYECSLSAKTYKLGLSTNCGFEISEWLLENDESISYNLFTFNTKPIYINLTPGLVLQVKLELVLDLEGYTSGYFKSHASKDIGVEVGITQNGTYSNTYSTGNDNKIFQIDSLNAKLSFRLPFYPKAVVGIYEGHIVNGKIEPYISLGAEANCELEDEELFKMNPTIKLYVKGGVDASVNIFEDSKISVSKTGKITSFDIWQKGWPLLPVLDSKSVSIVPKKSGETYVLTYGFSSDGILQKWKDNMWAGAKIVNGDNLIQQKPSEGIADKVSAKKKYVFTFDNLSLELDQSYMARPIVFYNNNIYECNGIAFTVNGLTFNTKDYYIKSVKYYEAYSDGDIGCDFWNRDHYHYYHDLIFEVDGSERAAEIGNQCTTDDYHKELSLSLHDGILKGQYVYLTTDKVSSFMVETVPYAYMLNGERVTFEPYQFRLWRDESIVSEWYK